MYRKDLQGRLSAFVFFLNLSITEKQRSSDLISRTTPESYFLKVGEVTDDIFVERLVGLAAVLGGSDYRRLLP